MFENLVKAFVDVAESLVETLKEMLQTFVESMTAISTQTQQRVYKFSPTGYGDAADLPERHSSSIIEIHSAPIS